jgi:hypothetical protein
MLIYNIIGEHSTSTRRALGEHSASTRRALGEHSASTRRALGVHSASTRRALNEHSTLNFFKDFKAMVVWVAFLKQPEMLGWQLDIAFQLFKYNL